MTHTNAPWSGMIPVDDTALWTTDTGGSGRPVVYLNGSYADLKHWRPVVAELDPDAWRHIRYDERARGRRSKKSADYSFEATIRDLDAVLTARGIERPILVGWSYGAVIAMHWAARHPDRVAGVVSVDGALPVPDDLIGDNFAERARKLFRRIGWMFPVARRFGLAARMSPAQHAEVNIEVVALQTDTALSPVLDRVECPARYVLGKGGHLGSDDEEMAKVRASLDAVLARKPRFAVTARVPVDHERIVRKGYPQIAAAVREVAAAVDQQEGTPLR